MSPTELGIIEASRDWKSGAKIALFWQARFRAGQTHASDTEYWTAYSVRVSQLQRESEAQV